MKSHTTGETLLCPACAAFIRTMIGTDAEEEIKKIPLPDVTINRHINNMSVPNNEKKFLKKESDIFALQMDGSTDIGSFYFARN
jgi:hypothetical protein